MRFFSLLLISFCTVMTLSGITSIALAEQPIKIVGSSTVYPFAKAVAEAFSEKTGHPLPELTTTGSGGGLKLFCAGNSPDTPDITNASRRIKRSEYDLCQKNGVTKILEIKIGYDGIVLANAKAAPDFQLTTRELYLALAAQVPNPDNSGKLIPNPYVRWAQINPDLPDMTIEVLGPPTTSGTRDAFSELALDQGCQEFPWLKQIKKRDKSSFRKVCRTLRTDGYFIEAGERDDLIVENLQKSPQAMGIFGYNFLARDREHLKGAIVNGIKPSEETIASATYPLSRALYFYVKADRLDRVTGLVDYINEFTSAETWGSGGYLSRLSLVPMPKKEQQLYHQVFHDRIPLVWE
ncbi:MAG: substrate-binding domain-containing protein [Desulfuromonadales bacterium]|nr:substrate-binding domain-containing protein [Desulfuromonadales bacterium]MBN2791631.1 substrate-binding domain-containing protein [Desulfuromonadales bacterium]